ncbi:MAG: SCO1664 family protein [Anaerolineales bacterium]|jgi:hypothetical protein
MVSKPLPTNALEVLANGEIRVLGEFLWGSNYTFLVQVVEGQTQLKAVYKPIQGEQPLWDFPRASLAARETAAYVACEALAWGFVPPTILRQSAPAGPGSVQLFVDVDPQRHYFTFSDKEKQLLRPVALFDILINNADRKGGHVLLAADGHIWLIDHGLSFHHEPKLRTVIWDFASQPIPKKLLADLQAFRTRLDSDAPVLAALAELLSQSEIEALRTRADWLLRERRFPAPGPGRPYPWPLV